MPEPTSLELSNFAGGWKPSDDIFNGDHNALLSMNNMELDQNGALTMASGTSLYWQIPNNDPAHTLFSFYYNGTIYVIICTKSGAVYVYNGSADTKLTSNGSTTIAACVTAFSWAIIASGNFRIKYNPITGISYDLGLPTPTAAPIVTLGPIDTTASLNSPTTLYLIENNATVTPGSQTTTTINISSFNQGSDNWQTYNADGTSVVSCYTVNDPVPPGYSTSIEVLFDSANPTPAGFLDLRLSGLSKNLSISGGGNTDTFSISVNQTAKYFSLAGNLTFTFTDSNGYTATHVFNTTSVSQIGQWITLNCSRGSFTLSNSGFDWTNIAKEEITANVPFASIPGSPANVSIYFAAGFFSAVITTAGIPPAVFSSVEMETIIPTANAIFQCLNSAPTDWSNFASGATETDNDTITFTISVSDSGNSFAYKSITSILFNVLLANPGSDFIPGSDYYTYNWINNVSSVVDTGYGQQSFNVQIARNQFTRVGSSSADWSTVYGIQITVYVNSIVNVFINASTAQLAAARFGLFMPSGALPMYFIGGTKSLNGTYQYAQMFVYNNGSYLGKSQLGPASNSITVTNGTTLVTPQDPTAIDPQINEVWVFRRGTDMDQWYRVLVFNANTGFITPEVDNLSSADAEILDIIVNANLVTINSGSITDPILDIVGPMEGRWFYFTPYFCYPSDINDPDLVDASLSVRITNGPLEIYLWARKVSEGNILVGTSKDIYSLTGTFQTLADGTIDIYFRPLGIGYPPISPDAFVFEYAIYYLSGSGFRSINILGQNPPLTSPALDKLFSGQVAPDLSELQPISAAPLQYNPVITSSAILNNVRFPICIAVNKLWAGIQTSFTAGQFYIWDFIRQYWRPFDTIAADGPISITACTVTPDGLPLFCFGNGKLRRLGVYNPANPIDNITPQSVTVLTPVFPIGNTDNFKHFLSIKGRVTANLTFTIQFITDQGRVSIQVTSDALGFFIVDLTQYIIGKYFYMAILATASSFKIRNLRVSYVDFPELLTSYQVYPTNFGSPTRKRVRVWPFQINTYGQNVNFIPMVDGVVLTAQMQTFNTTKPTTVFFQFTADVFGVDYGMLIGAIADTERDIVPPTETSPFEIWDVGKPDVVQSLPIVRRYWQAGPQEFFRFGTVDLLSFRLMTDGIVIPYKVFTNDTVLVSGTFDTIPNIEQSYEVALPKGVAGQILRVELGPTLNNVMYIYYVHCRVKQMGGGTEKEWQVLPLQQDE